MIKLLGSLEEEKDFQSQADADKFLEEESLRVLDVSKSDFKRLGFYPPAVKEIGDSLAMARKRVRRYWSVGGNDE